jgi:hypothetical protein
MSSIRARVEHVFRALKRPFGYTKARYEGITKNAAQVCSLLGLINFSREMTCKFMPPWPIKCHGSDDGGQWFLLLRGSLKARLMRNLQKLAQVDGVRSTTVRLPQQWGTFAFQRQRPR